ncbi:MAG: hypothetical protein PHX19_02050 [Bacilli bacterium]|nr:hypothetical protein [Bacilli bacterium]MDD4407812.1 hypothetical protein [Bacilli bacterium]
MNYLEQFDITEEDISLLKQNLKPDVILNFEVMRNNVIEVLTYLKELGVANLLNVITFRPDLCFRTVHTLEQELIKIDKELLLYIFNNTIDDLTNFNI